MHGHHNQRQKETPFPHAPISMASEILANNRNSTMISSSE